MPESAIIYYTRSGTARMAALQLADYYGWPAYEVRNRVPRVGLAGDLRCVLDAWLHRRPAYDYDGPPLAALRQAVIVAPVWMRSLAAPMQAFLREQAPVQANLSLVLVMSGEDGDQAAADATASAGRAPSRILKVRQYAVLAGECDEQFDNLGYQLACNPQASMAQ